eukprot:g20122.t1
MVPPGTQPRGRSSGGTSDAFPEKRRPSASTSTCGVDEVLVEICTPGARPPIHFVEELSASRPWRSSARSGSSGGFIAGAARGKGRGLLSPTLFSRQQAPSVAAASSSPSFVTAGSASPTPGKHHRRSASPLDGVCFTLLGVSTGLKTPGVDPWAVAQALVDSSVDLRCRNDRGMTPLHLACSAGQLDVTRVLLLAGADSHARDHRSRCPLHMAALSGNAELITSLLTCGADPNKASDVGTTALHNAALLGRVEVSRALLVAGADVNCTDHNSFSPLYLASQNGHTQLVLDLLAAGADAGIKTNRGFTPLHVAARCGRLPVLKALLDAGEAADSLSYPAETTPLHLSAGFSRLSCVQELVERGADPSRRSKRGATPLDMVGTLIIPVSANGGGSSKARAAREAYEKKLAQGARVKVVLARAQRWQRRRGAMLVWEALRRRAAAVASAAAAAAAAQASSAVCDAPEGSVGAGRGARVERSGDEGGSRKRCRAPQGGHAAAAGGQGWLVEQLCAYPDAALMQSVIRFL